MTDEQVRALGEPAGALQPVFTDEERAVVLFAERLTAHPPSIQEEDLARLAKYLTKEQVVELVLTVAVANFTNRVNEGLRTPVDA